VICQKENKNKNRQDSKETAASLLFFCRQQQVENSRWGEKQQNSRESKKQKTGENKKKIPSKE